MPAGIRWRKSRPSKPSERWTFVHLSDKGANPDAVVTIDGTDPQRSVVIANDAARAYLDTEDGVALTRIISQYSQAREAPQTLTLARGNWKLAVLEADAKALLQHALDGNTPDHDATTVLQARITKMRDQIDRIEYALR